MPDPGAQPAAQHGSTEVKLCFFASREGARLVYHHGGHRHDPGGEFFRFAREETDQDPFHMTFNYEFIYVSDWSKAGFSEVDYGFGPPTFAGPLVNNDVITSVVNSSSSRRRSRWMDGTRMLAS